MSNIVTLPGLIDPHVHLRDPGQTEKEDFTTGTEAALAGGFTTLLDMPNNTTPVTSKEILSEKITLAKDKILCDVGFYFGSQGDNLNEFQNIEKSVFGLKLYLNKTTGNFLIEKEKLSEVFRTWTDTKPILLHAIDETIDDVIDVLKSNPRPIHICHVSSRYELSKIIKAKEQNLPITCGVTPHHLFLSENDEKTLGSFGKMQPPLRKQSDLDFLWTHLQAIDCIESDHAPHTKEEKQSEPTPFGVPGLETTLPLLLTAVSKKKLLLDDVIRLCHKGPKDIFHLPATEDTTTEVDLNAEYEIRNENLLTKSKWSPFDGWKVKGKVIKVVLRKTTVFENGEILETPGSGKILTP